MTTAIVFMLFGVRFRMIIQMLKPYNRWHTRKKEETKSYAIWSAN